MSKNLITAMLLMFALSACAGGANLVRKDRVGGRVDLTGAYMPAMADARLLMVEHCKGRFVAVEQGDHVVFACQASGSATPELIARAR